EVGRVGTVDPVVGRRTASGGVDGGDRLGQGGAVGETAVGPGGEGDGGGNPGVSRGPGDPDRLGGVADGHRVHLISLSRREGFDLLAVIAVRPVLVHAFGRVVGVGPRPDASADHHG